MAGPRLTVGNVEIVALLDTPMEFDWAMFFPNNPRSDFRASFRNHGVART